MRPDTRAASCACPPTPPQVPLRWMLAYGMTISVGQFAFLFYAMYVGMPAGLASLVLLMPSAACTTAVRLASATRLT